MPVAENFSSQQVLGRLPFSCCTIYSVCVCVGGGGHFVGTVGCRWQEPNLISPRRLLKSGGRTTVSQDQEVRESSP